MKKKQKQKLLNQFRPSLDGVRGQLFRSLEEESLRRVCRYKSCLIPKTVKS